MAKSVLGLKWGTLKDWSGVQKDNLEAQAALEKYFSEGSHMSAMMQHDSDGQKEAICELIDAVDEIYNDWSGEYMTKEEAKKYVMGYHAN